MSRSPVSGFVICHNEEDDIYDCLKSIGFCDELVVVDSGSTDKTLEIAKEFGAKIHHRCWTGFKDQKQYGLDLCSNKWVINLDADERVSSELKEEILNILEEDGKEDKATSGYEINRVVFFQGRWWRRGGWYPEFRLRFFKKKDIVWGGVDPHEKPICSGKTERLKHEILHYTYVDFFDQASRLIKYARIMATEEYKRGKRASFFKVFVNPISRFIKFYFIKRGILEGKMGFVIALMESYYTFLKYLFLWEKNTTLGNNEAKKK